MRHLPVDQGFEHNISYILGQRSEQGRTSHNDLLTDADHQIRIPFQHRIQNLKMLHDHSLVLGSHPYDGLRDGLQIHIFSRGSGIHVEGPGGIESHILRVQQGHVGDIILVIPVHYLNPRKHTLDHHAFSGVLGTDDADNTVKRVQIHLGDLLSQFHHSTVSSRCIEKIIQIALMAYIVVNHKNLSL